MNKLEKNSFGYGMTTANDIVRSCRLYNTTDKVGGSLLSIGFAIIQSLKKNRLWDGIRASAMGTYRNVSVLLHHAQTCLSSLKTNNMAYCVHNSKRGFNIFTKDGEWLGFMN